ESGGLEMEVARLVLDYLRVLIWPVLLVAIAVHFRKQIEDLLERARVAKELKVGLFGQSIEISGALETAAQLAASIKSDEPDREGATGQIVKSISTAARTGVIEQLGGKRVLWVDDEPQNNEHGIKALQAQGVQVTVSTSTRDAVMKAQATAFNVIVTDQLRIEDGTRAETAGYDLMSELQKLGIKVPVILSTAFPDRDEAGRRGFYDATNTQHSVFELVMKAITSK